MELVRFTQQELRCTNSIGERSVWGIRSTLTADQEKQAAVVDVANAIEWHTCTYALPRVNLC